MTYEDWDAKRRERFPEARHFKWDSYDNPGTHRLAEWDPHTGRAWVAKA